MSKLAVHSTVHELGTMRVGAQLLVITIRIKDGEDSKCIWEAFTKTVSNQFDCKTKTGQLISSSYEGHVDKIESGTVQSNAASIAPHHMSDVKKLP